MNGRNMMVRAIVGLSLLAAIVLLAGCDMQMAGLRLAPDETQKQAADAADALAGRLAVTGARPGSAATKALAKMTRPATVYAGAPSTPLELEALADIEANVWKRKDDAITAARLRDDLRGRAMKIVTTRLADFSDVLADSKIGATAILDRFAAVATVAQMADELAEVVPDPAPVNLSPEAKAIADAATAAVDRISKAANAAAANAKPDLGTVVDKGLDSVEKTLDKAVAVKDRAVGFVDQYGTELVSVLSLFGLGAGGYAVKKKRDAGKAQAERDEVKTEATIQAQVAAAIEAAKTATAPATADGTAS